ncbi:MAG: efflux RND transporter periplasmic adaptor subunit, partial [Patescibacteria group bacterium]
GVYFYATRTVKPKYDFVGVKRGDITQEASVTGRVKPAESVDLAFERSGKVAKVAAKIGDRVRVGAMLVSLVNGDIAAQLLQAKAKLEELQKGARPEEIQSAETAVANAKRTVENAEANLSNAKSKAEADLQDDYDAALMALQKSVNLARNSLFVLTDIQMAHFGGSDQNGVIIAEKKAEAVHALLGEANADRASNSLLSTFSGGVFGIVQNAITNPTHDNIDPALAKTSAALYKIQTALYAVPITTDLTTAEKTNLAAEKTNINTEISNISAKEQAIAVQAAANASAISTAKADVTAATNALAAAEDALALKKSGTVPEQIKAQEANVKNYEAQLMKTVISSPIDGIVTKQEAKVGEIMPANAAIVSVMSEKQLRIEADIPEADIAKIKIGDTASMTLDAYGSDTFFTAKVISIDPAETIIAGVATYKTTFAFISEDGRLKPGMTVNMDILTAKGNNILAIPERSIFVKDGEKYIRLVNDGGFREQKIETGLRGSGGEVEITFGLSEGDKVIIFLPE